MYPQWLSHLLPDLSEVSDPFSVSANSYYVFNGNGYPSLLDNHLKNAIADVNEIGMYNYLVLCLDADDDSVEQRKNEVLTFIKRNDLILYKAKLVIIVQNKCIESWFLGNRKIFTNQPQSKELRNYIKYYNVQINDPESMSKMYNFSTTAQFHEAYLAEMLNEKNIRYSKKNPNGVIEKYYLEELIARQNDTNHLPSFKVFIDFCKEVSRSMSI